MGMMAFYWNNDFKQNLPIDSEKKSECLKRNSLNFGPLQNFDYMVTPVCLFLILLVMIVNESVGLARIRCSIFAVLIIMMGTKQQSALLTNPVVTSIGCHAYSVSPVYI